MQYGPMHEGKRKKNVKSTADKHILKQCLQREEEVKYIENILSKASPIVKSRRWKRWSEQDISLVGNCDLDITMEMDPMKQDEEHLSFNMTKLKQTNKSASQIDEVMPLLLTSLL